MQHFEKTLLVTDMDGTLVPHGQQVAEADREALRRFAAGGGRLAVATGRTPDASAAYLRGLPVSAPCAFFNGAMLYDWERRQVLEVQGLTGPAGEPGYWPDFAAEVRETFPRACVEIYLPDSCHIISDPGNDDPRLLQEYYHCAHTELRELSDLARTPWLKFFVCAPQEDLLQLQELARQRGIYGYAHGCYSDTNYYEFLAPGANKGAVVAALRKLPEFAGWRIVAAGDYTNDNEMLAAADIGVAAAGGHPSTLAVADVVGCTAEEHLLAWIIGQVL